MKKKVMLVFGTRPEAIKMFPVYQALRAMPESFEICLCVTGQHVEMLKQVLDFFEMEPDYDLAVMEYGQDLFDITTKVLLKLRPVIQEWKPEILLVHGDTTTTMAASLAAFYSQIKVGHVEAGLRTGNKYSPWPEEVNRKIASSIADFHFAPTQANKVNLMGEKITEKKIFVTGNTVVDSLQAMVRKIQGNVDLRLKIEERLTEKGLGDVLVKLQNRESKLLTVTCHRRESFGDGFQSICKSLKKVSVKYPEIEVVYPVHLNPNVQKPVYGILGELENVTLVSPIEYMEFVYLMSLSWAILTDSGGIQEEAPSLGVPVLVMRESTERPESVEAGVAKLVGVASSKIFESIQELMEKPGVRQSMACKVNPYGDGKAGTRIAEILARI